MAILALDTATETLSVALAPAEGPVREKRLAAGRKHLELLLPTVVELMETCGVGFPDLEGIACGIGPGTFSGLRVGVATARALAQSLKVPVAACSTLDALAAALAARADSNYQGVMPLIDARRRQVFTRLYRIGDDRKPRPMSAVACIDPEAVAGFGRETLAGRLLAGGDGALAYAGEIGGDIELLPREEDAHRVSAARHFEAAAFRPYTGVKDLAALVPEYVRQPDADKTILRRKRLPWQR